MRFSLSLRALCSMALASSLWMGQPAQAHSEASLALSVMPVASVVLASGAAAGAALAVPAALSVTGAALTVTAVQVSANTTVYVLERASDGAQASIALAGTAASAAMYSVGTVVACSVISTGVVLSVAGEVLAFVPNALGQALLYNERL